MPQNFYELVWIFLIYAFLGWCTEVAYAALDTGKFVNRGFLNGPYCPIYGCGVVIVVAALTPLKDSLFLLFLGSFILTTALEYVTGFVLEKVFHNKWWDYSGKPFNIQGYICLKFSILWGLACTFVMDAVHPLIYKLITMIPHTPGIILLLILMLIFAVDCCVTVSTILKFNKRIKLMHEMAATLHKLSDEIGENIYENVTGAIEKSEAFQENHPVLMEKLADARENISEIPEATKEKLSGIRENISELPGATKEKFADFRENVTERRVAVKQVIAENRMEIKSKLETKHELEAKQKEYAGLKEKYNRLLEEKNFGFKRLLNAFPDMTSRDRNETLQKYKEYFNIKKKKRG